MTDNPAAELLDKDLALALAVYNTLPPLRPFWPMEPARNTRWYFLVLGILLVLLTMLVAILLC